MSQLNTVDYTVIVIYFCCLVALGLFLKKMASQSLEDYFLGGRRLPWWALGISGMASYLDITGTMIIVSFLFMLGPRGLFIEFRGGAVLPLAFMLLWTGKWHRRSGCITGAEWMEFRFGSGFGGQFARLTQALASILLTVGMLAYLVKGVGLFLSMFLPFSPLVCSMVMLGVAAVYTMVSGFYGVVFTDMFQSFIIMTSVIAISTLALRQVPGVEVLGNLAREVTGSNSWTTSSLQWNTSMPAGYEAYRHLGMFALFYFFRQMIGGLGSGAEPMYFGARSDRECGLLTFLWTWLMSLRWPMMMAFAVLGIYMVKNMFPSQEVLVQAAELIRSNVGAIDKSRWADTLSAIMNNPGAYPEIVTGLRDILGASWQQKLHLLSFEGTVNAERILPAVVLYSIPMGFRGMILIALIAASMSTFDSTVNRTTGYFIRDIYQRYLRPHASNKEMIYASWIFITVVVVLGFVMGYATESINDIWGWINMSFWAGLIIPLLLRMHWWRFNGGGFAVGTVVGMVFAVMQRAFMPGMDERIQFLLGLTISLTGAIIGTYMTKPTDRKILENFYRVTRPFGLWGPFLHALDDKTRAATKREHRNDIISLPFALGWQITLFILPMQIIIKAWHSFAITFVVFLLCLGGLYIFWFRNLSRLDSVEGS